MEVRVPFQSKSSKLLDTHDFNVRQFEAHYWLPLEHGLLLTAQCIVLQQRLASRAFRGEEDGQALVRDQVRAFLQVDFYHAGAKIDEVRQDYLFEAQEAWLGRESHMARFCVGTHTILFRLSGSYKVRGMILREIGSLLWPEVRERVSIKRDHIPGTAQEESIFFHESWFILPEALLVEYTES